MMATPPDAGPTQAIEGCRSAHRRLLSALEGLTDEQARQASRLPAWSVGHVLTHLARNADSCVRRLDGSARGDIVDQYPGGPAGRAAEIEAGAARSAAALVADVTATAAAVEAAIEAMPPRCWPNRSRAVSGRELTASEVVVRRWHEIEVHHVDLGLGYEPADWPADLVASWLPAVVAALPSRAHPSALLAWALDRAPAPDLRPWG